VHGPRFRSVHLQLDQIVALARLHADHDSAGAHSSRVVPGRPATWSLALPRTPGRRVPLRAVRGGGQPFAACLIRSATTSGRDM
jgi:hypothetical protein